MYPATNRRTMSSGQNPRQNARDSATAAAWVVSSVTRPAGRRNLPPGSISIIRLRGAGQPSMGAPNASPIASPASAPTARSRSDIKVTNKVYLPGRVVNFEEGESVQKEELLHLHMLMIHIKKYYEGITEEEISTDRYSSLEISPVHIHKNKKCHKDAILVLGDEIVTHIRSRTPLRMDYTAETASESVAIEH